MKALKFKQTKAIPCMTDGVATGEADHHYSVNVYRDLRLSIREFHGSHRVGVSMWHRSTKLCFTFFSVSRLVRAVCIRKLVMDGAYKDVGHRYVSGKAGTSVDDGLKIFETVQYASKFSDSHCAEIAEFVRGLVDKINM